VNKNVNVKSKNVNKIDSARSKNVKLGKNRSDKSAIDSSRNANKNDNAKNKNVRLDRSNVF
jgi:hypothetical protein